MAKDLIIVLAFPDTFVRMSDEWICRVLPWFGLGSNGLIKAGHAAQVLVDSKSGKFHYADFGRYVTPEGMGRVRTAHTDLELEIPFTPIFDELGNLSNLDEVLLWLESNSTRTHGVGRMIASVCDQVNMPKALEYVNDLQSRGSIPYGAFKQGSNCSRFVADTIYYSTFSKLVKQQLYRRKLFTPSTVGNVVSSATKGSIWEVYQGEIKQYSGTALKENLTNYFARGKVREEVSEAIERPIAMHYLHGIGSSAYFHLSNQDLALNHFRIRRYNSLVELDFDGIFHGIGLNVQEQYQIVYDSNCAYCHVQQGDKKIRLDRITLTHEFSSWQKEHSA